MGAGGPIKDGKGEEGKHSINYFNRSLIELKHNLTIVTIGLIKQNKNSYPSIYCVT